MNYYTDVVYSDVFSTVITDRTRWECVKAHRAAASLGARARRASARFEQLSSLQVRRGRFSLLTVNYLSLKRRIRTLTTN